MSSRPLLNQLLLGCLLVGLTSGCVRRRMTIRTNPAGASVFVDKQFIGTSPAATSFTYYGTREVEVVKDGYRTEKILRRISPPWYELPPLDFFSETLWPREIRDERIIDISLVPEQVLPSEELQARANNLRLQASQGLATPLPPTVSGGTEFPGNPNMNFPTQPLDPTFQTTPPPVIPPAAGSGSSWRPGQLLQNFLQPGGQPVTRIPEAGILPGGGYRPDLGQ